MAKLSRVSLARKRELEKPDRVLEFLQGAYAWVGLYRRQVIISAGIFLAAVVIIVGFSYFSARAERAAFDRLTRIMSSHTAGADVAAADTGQQYFLLNEKHGRTVAGKIAGLQYADACYQSGECKKAIVAYQKALSDFKGNDFFRRLALTGLGYAYESEGSYDQAMACFEQIIDDPQALVKSEALFHLGRLYELKGDLKNSRVMFSRIVADYPDSLYAAVVRESGGG